VGTQRRRASGEGSIFQRADGRWIGQLGDLGWRDGKRERPTVSGATKEETAAKLGALKRDIERGLPVPDQRRTTADYLRWWAAEVLSGSVKDSTADDYRWILEHYVIPHVGRTRLAKLTPQHVQSMLRALERQGLAVRTRRYARAVLRSALGQAERWDLVSRNAAALVDLPRMSSKIDDALTLDEAKALLDAAHGDRLEAIVTVALAVGLRKGEALALRWEDIDLDEATLSVTGTLKRRTGLGLVRDTPKTERGRRTIPLPKVCVDALRTHKSRQSAERLAAGPTWADDGYVFTTPIGTPIDPRNLTRLYHALTERAGLGRGRFHALRHSAATIAHALGVPLEVISKTLGHAGYAITADIYAHVGAKVERDAADAMDRAFLKSS
jgi:integrase